MGAVRKPQNSCLWAEVCEEELLGCESVLPEGFEFSEEFERRMSGVIGGRRPYLRGRLKAALVIAVIFAAGFCLGMGREPIWNYIISKNADGTKSVTFDVGSIKDPKKRIEEIYSLDIPKGYELIDSCQHSGSVMQLWNRYSDGDDFFFFYQFLPSAYTEATFGDGAVYYFDEDGVQYYIDEEDGWTGVVWQQDGYVFLITGSFTKDETLDLCKTLKISKDKGEFSQSGK